jgi:hypothetical protein
LAAFVHPSHIVVYAPGDSLAAFLQLELFRVKNSGRINMGIIDWILTGIAVGLIVGALIKIFGKKKEK